jgi:hypothetical protein
MGGRVTQRTQGAQRALRKEKQEHRLKPVLLVGRRFCGGVGWDKMAVEGRQR